MEVVLAQALQSLQPLGQPHRPVPPSPHLLRPVPPPHPHRLLLPEEVVEVVEDDRVVAEEVEGVGDVDADPNRRAIELHSQQR